MERFIAVIYWLSIVVNNGNIIAGNVVPQTHDLTDNCGKTIQFSDSVILKGMNLTESSCTVAVQSTDALNGLLLDFNTLNLSDSCSHSSLEVVDFFGNVIAGPLCKGKLKEKIFKTGNSVASIKYDSDVTSTNGSSFSLIITSFNNGTDGTCTSSEFQCRNKLCISNELVCNKVNECSDNSDETIGCKNPDDVMKQLLTILISVASVGLFIALLACCCCCCKKTKVYAYVRMK